MGITRDTMLKHRETGGKRKQIRKKRKFMLARPAAMTKLGPKRIHLVRCMGGNIKHRAMRLDTGNFSWGSEVCTRKTRVLDVTYNASNNELLRTKTLVKNCVVQIDATPFRQWYDAHYGVSVVTKTRSGEEAEVAAGPKSVKAQERVAARQKNRTLDPLLADQFNSGRLYACVSSRPGQSGRCDGYILEGLELKFYLKHMKKKGKKASA